VIVYHVTVRRWKRGWELHIDGVGVTQSTSLAGAERMVRDHLALVFDADPDTFQVAITPEIDPTLSAELRQAREKAAAAAQLQRTAAEMSCRVARELHTRCNLSGADVAAVLGVSPQRASQLLKG